MSEFAALFAKNIVDADLPSALDPLKMSEIHYPARPEFCFIDWLRVTNVNMKNFFTFAKFMIKDLKSLGFEIHDTGRGMNGYTDCFAVTFNSERCGSFAADSADKMGGLFELTGRGCQLLQTNWPRWCAMIDALNTCNFTIKRLDVSADLMGQDWFENGYTVPDLLVKADGEEYRIGATKQGRSPEIVTMGGWSSFVAGKITAHDYEPEKHCPSGLSFQIGKRNCANSILFYEKGKQMLGAGMFSKLSDIEAAWVRVERRYTSGSGASKVVIPFDFAVQCDQAFCYKCQGLADLLKEYSDITGGKDPHELRSETVIHTADREISLEKVAYFQSKFLLRKAYWASQHAGRFIKTMLTMGYDSVYITNLLSSAETIKSFVDDLSDCKNIDLEFSRIKYAQNS